VVMVQCERNSLTLNWRLHTLSRRASPRRHTDHELLFCIFVSMYTAILIDCLSNAMHGQNISLHRRKLPLNTGGAHGRFLSSPLPSPFLPSPPLSSPPLLSLPLPSPPFPLEVGPPNPARGSGERCKLLSSPSGVWGGALAEIEFGAF